MNEALKNFKRAFDEAAHIDEEAQITSLNRQGRIYLWQQNFAAARSVFEQAVTKAIDVRDSYQEVESRIDLARVLAYMQEYELYSQQLEPALAIAQQQHYGKLLGEIEKLQGELSYQQQKYADAFLHYAIFCHFMVFYHPFEYSEALRFLIHELLTMDDSAEVAKVLEVLRSYWKDQELESKFPEFLRVCDHVDQVKS